MLGVELKNLNADSINLGTLGQTAHGYGGSIDRLVYSAGRFFNSSNAQLKDESQAIMDAYRSGDLQNALYTNVQNVSEGAQNVFNNVYTSAQNGAANVVKELAPAASAVGGAVNTGLKVAGGFVGGCETMFSGIFFYKKFDLYNTTTS